MRQRSEQLGHDFSWLLRAPAFHRAVVRIDTRSLNIEWAQDSAFRFYPVHEDDRFGYRLHDADAAINKVLALAGTQRDPRLRGRAPPRRNVSVARGAGVGGMRQGPRLHPGIPAGAPRRGMRHIRSATSTTVAPGAARSRDPQAALARGSRSSVHAGGGSSTRRGRRPVPGFGPAAGLAGSVVRCVRVLARHRGSVRGAWPRSRPTATRNAAAPAWRHRGGRGGSRSR